MIDYNKKIEELSSMRDAHVGKIISLHLYAEVESIHDPNFLRWLFDDPSIPDFTLPQDRMLEYHHFLDHLEHINAR